MHTDTFDLNAYCERIHYQGLLKSDFATVKALMQQQLMTVPFENLDVLAKKPISIQPNDIVHKIIPQKRGGYCYEVNGIFAMALGALHIPYEFVAARPLFYPVRRPRTHLALVVQVGGHEYLVDLGFGSFGIREPMRLDMLEESIQQGYETFKLSRADDGDTVLEALVEGNWVKQYGFNRTQAEWVDFVPANWLNSTHPDAVFTQKPLLVLFTKDGRKTLFGNVFKHYDKGEMTQRIIEPEALADCCALEFKLIP
ncbi:arylamine N-acetyltransferase family protein [Thiolinea disciformis]|uniref:arylamine N-acetyltransferase family protein n=1 Tax=Thiolinea disciformis TaxID=125614 RepID=UPI00037271A4|nr:arylamine N-acetyltransferase [Thiolinea disciformis]